MKRFLNEHGLWVLFATAVIAVALAAMSAFSNTSSPLTNLANTAAAPFRAAYASVADWFNDNQRHYADVTALEEENAALRSKIAQMEEDIRQAQDDREENALLRELLGLREQRKDFEFESADITEETSSNWTSALTLNKGTLHGVEKNDCVIDATGALVGVIREVGTNWSTVLTVVDTDASFGAQVFRTKALCLAEGDFSLMEEGRLLIRYLPGETQLLAGDLIQTSGLGGYYPSGLVIGTVDTVQLDDSGAASYATISPAADLDNLTEVFIIKSFDIVS